MSQVCLRIGLDSMQQRELELLTGRTSRIDGGIMHPHRLFHCIVINKAMVRHQAGKSHHRTTSRTISRRPSAHYHVPQHEHGLDEQRELNK